MDSRSFKQHLLEEIYAPYKNITRCPVDTSGCQRVVLGEGDPDAKLMFVGEAPGREEDEQGRPFVGRSGKLLTKTLESLGVKRNDVFITNIVKCRPPENRKPLPSEITFYKPLLLHEIKIVRPKVICTLGSSALEAFVNGPFTMGSVRGKPLKWGGVTLFPTFHPSYVLRTPDAFPLFKHDLIEAIKLSCMK